MESKTLLLDLVQQRKDGRITQEEMVRQLVELRNQVRSHTHTVFVNRRSSFELGALRCEVRNGVGCLLSFFAGH